MAPTPEPSSVDPRRGVLVTVIGALSVLGALLVSVLLIGRAATANDDQDTRPTADASPMALFGGTPARSAGSNGAQIDATVSLGDDEVTVSLIADTAAQRASITVRTEVREPVTVIVDGASRALYVPTSLIPPIFLPTEARGSEYLRVDLSALDLDDLPQIGDEIDRELGPELDKVFNELDLDDLGLDDIDLDALLKAVQDATTITPVGMTVENGEALIHTRVTVETRTLVQQVSQVLGVVEGIDEIVSQLPPSVEIDVWTTATGDLRRVHFDDVIDDQPVAFDLTIRAEPATIELPTDAATIELPSWGR